MGLTGEQLAFLDHDPRESGRLLAGPGAGKSFTAVAYLKKLADEHPEIRAQMLTFTRAATQEFADTMEEHGVTNAERPSTIHALALRILARADDANIPKPIRIPDSWEEKHLILPHLTRLVRRRHNEIDQKTISKLQDEMAAGWESLDDTPLLSDVRPEWRSVYVGTWGLHRRVFGYTLLAELPYRAGNLIEDTGLKGFDINLLLVDEYQDLNEADIKLLRLLHKGGVPIIAIGDDDQSIYSWRNASPAGIRRFMSEFGATNDFPLTISHRAGKNILDRAVALIEAAPGRDAKTPPTPSGESPDGRFAYLRFNNDEDEVQGVARIVASRVAAGVDPAKIALLVRSSESTWAAQLKPVLEARGVTLATAEWVYLALGDPELRRGLAYARLLENADDSLSYWSLMEVTQGVGVGVVDTVFSDVRDGETFAAALRRLAEEGSQTVKPAVLKKVRELLAKTDARVQAFNDALIDEAETNWGTWIADLLDPALLSEDARRLLELVGSKAPDATLSTVANQLEVLGKDFAFSEGGGVRLMPIARSKGLTVDTAILIGVESGLMPLPRGHFEEERRLLYVGLTRAKQVCVMTMTTFRRGPLAFRGTRGYGARRRSELVEDLAGFQTLPGTAYIDQHFA